MVIEEVRRARELRNKHSEHKPVILPIRVNLPKNFSLDYDLGSYLNPIQHQEWKSSDDTSVILEEILNLLSSGKVPTLEEPCGEVPTIVDLQENKIPATQLIPRRRVVSILAGLVCFIAVFYVVTNNHNAVKDINKCMTTNENNISNNISNIDKKYVDEQEEKYRNQGRTFFAEQEYKKVIEAYENSYTLAQENGNTQGLIESLYYLGHAYKALNQDTKAQECFEKGKEKLVNSKKYSGYFTQGQASFSDEQHKGYPTISGEEFDPDLLTAGHSKLPLGTIVRVTNSKTGDSVVVRINDNGPNPTTGLIINLSESAALEIQMKVEGIIPVTLEAADFLTELDT
ncbi:MAG: hypothetical protein F6K47_29150 [Symploca sp. SIO2E6]|nr:hypothetical protein [Symploca sp. SIO2E6]